MKKFQAGFTLIELMIVVAIIGILAAIAIPAYQDYTVRAQVTEGLNLAAEVKTAISDFHAARGRLPTNNTSSGVSNAASITGNYVSQVNVTTGGTINITYGNKVNTNASGGILTLRPGENAAKGLVWICGKAATPTGTSAPAGTDATSLPNKYIPADCR